MAATGEDVLVETPLIDLYAKCGDMDGCPFAICSPGLPSYLVLCTTMII